MTDYIRTKPEPYCPLCGARMVLRRPRSGQTFEPFWGCGTFPDCRGTRTVEDVNETLIFGLTEDPGDILDEDDE